MIQFTQQQFFSFSDFLTALSLVVLAWGTTDPRYQFRTKIIPSLFSCMPSFSFRKLTFYVIAFVGFCILSLEMDQAVLGNSRLINHYAGEIIRGVLACTLLAFFIRWIYCSFIRPAVFSEKNSFNFLEAIKVAISRSSDSELMAAAEETEKSISQIIAYASSATDKLKNNQSPLNVELHAQKILVAITDKRFCEKIVESAPEFLVSIFTNIKNQTCARAFLPFAHNILIAAIGNPHSFLFRETELDDAGWINPVTPVCSAMFANYSVVEITENLIITDNSYLQFNPKQWQAYCRIVTRAMQSYISTNFSDEPYVLDAAISWIRNMVLDLQVLNEQNYFGIWDDPKIQKLKIMIGFTKNIPKILAHESGLPKDLTKINNLYEHTSHLILAIISGAASVQNPPYLCWKIQYELTWLPLFCDPILEKEEHWRNIRLMVEEAICKKIVDIGAIGWKVNRTDIKFLGYFLNVTGLASTKFDNDPNCKLKKKIQEWLVSNYDQLWKNENGDIGKFSLVGGMISYSPQKILIVGDNHPIFPGEKLQINQA